MTTSSTAQIPNGALVLAVSNRVVTAITGATSYSCGVDGNASQFGASLGVSAGSANLGLIGPNPFYAATSVLYTAAGGSFTGGAVRMTIHYLLPNAATASRTAAQAPRTVSHHRAISTRRIVRRDRERA